MRLNKYLFDTVNKKECGHGQQSVVWLKRGQPCLHHLHVLSTVFSWRPFSSFSLWIILLPPSLPPLILPLLNQCDGCLVPLAWGLMAGGRGFASHGGITLSRGWLCQRWKPLDIPGTHLHSATQLLISSSTNQSVKLKPPDNGILTFSGRWVFPCHILFYNDLMNGAEHPFSQGKVRALKCI